MKRGIPVAVAVSPFFHDGSYETTIGTDPLDKIILGGRTVWQREPAG